jgi:phage shock protein PspC (stress-responsive transcriptional regulator)
MYFVIQSTLFCLCFEPSNKVKQNTNMKKLFRIKGNESMLGGVFAGLAEYFEIDVTLLRVLAVGAFFTPIPIVFLYFIMWAVFPKKPQTFATLTQ